MYINVKCTLPVHGLVCVRLLLDTTVFMVSINFEDIMMGASWRILLVMLYMIGFRLMDYKSVRCVINPSMPSVSVTHRWYIEQLEPLRNLARSRLLTTCSDIIISTRIIFSSIPTSCVYSDNIRSLNFVSSQPPHCASAVEASLTPWKLKVFHTF